MADALLSMETANTFRAPVATATAACPSSWIATAQRNFSDSATRLGRLAMTSSTVTARR